MAAAAPQARGRAGRAGCSCVPIQDIRVGGRQSNAAYQYTLQADSTAAAVRMGAEAAGRAGARPGAARCQFRPAAEGPGNRPGDRPRHRQPARRQRQPDRQHAVRRVRPAPGLDHLQRAEPVPRHHGGGAALLAEPGDAEGHLRQHVRRHRQRHGDDQTPWSGTVATPQTANAARPRRHAAASIASSSARNAATNALANTGKGSASSGAAVSTSKETMVPLAAFTHFGPGNTPLAVNHQGAVRRHHDLLQPGAGQVAQRCDAAVERAMRQIGMPASIHGSFPGHRADLPAIAEQRADADPRRAGRRLHRAGHAVRELHPSDHHPVHPAIGRRRRGAGAAAVQHRVQHHRADRRDPADRHRQEERHHDDRLRAGGRTRRATWTRARRSSRPACCASARS